MAPNFPVKFQHKPLLIAGEAMAYYGLKKSDGDYDFIVSAEDFQMLQDRFADKQKMMDQDQGVALAPFEFWASIFKYDYEFYAADSIEEDQYLVISPEKLLFMVALVAHKDKYKQDLLLLAEFIRKRQNKSITH